MGQTATLFVMPLRHATIMGRAHQLGYACVILDTRAWVAMYPVTLRRLAMGTELALNLVTSFALARQTFTAQTARRIAKRVSHAMARGRVGQPEFAFAIVCGQALIAPKKRVLMLVLI
jgi:hypothetical protein